MGDPARAARFRWTIRRKLLALGAGTLIPVALLLVYWVWVEAREATRDVEARLRLAGEQAAAQVELLLEGLTGHVEALAAHPEIRGGDARTAARLLRGVAAEHPELEGLLVVDAEGRARVSATPEPVGAGIAIGDRPWFRAVRAGRRPVVGDFQVGRLTGYPVAIVAAPLLGPGQAFEGAVAGGVSLRRLHTLFAGLPFWGGITVTVLDADGRILAHAPGADESLLGRPLPSLGALAEGGRKVSRLAWLDGEERLAGLAHVPRARWRVVASAPSAVVRDRVEREVRAIGLPLLVLLGLAAAAGLLIARRVWRPLEALTAAVTRLPREAALRVRVDSTDEVGDLARAFDEMTVQVETARADLERQIAELGALSEAGRLLTSTLELSQVLQRLAELARARLDVDVVRIWLREGASNDYRLHAQAGATRDPEEFRMHLEPGQGLVGWIMDHREALVLADVQADPRLTNRAWATAEDLHAFLGIPIVLEDTPVGVLACVRRARREFSADDVRLARLFAPPAAVAILNARLYDEARGRTRQLELLHEAARTVAGEREITRLLQRLVETARSLTGARYAALALFEKDGTLCEFFTDGLDPEARARIGPPPQGRGLLGHIFASTRSLRLDDLTAHPDSVGFPPGHPTMRSLLAVPIGLKGETLGALYLTEKAGGFSEDDEARLNTLGADAAVALENAELVSSLRRALDGLEQAQGRLVESEALRAVGQLAAGMAHHLNNILAVVRGRTSLLLQGALDPAIRRGLEIVERAAVDGADVVRRLQAFSRPPRATGATRVDLNGLVQEVLELTRPRWRDEAERRGIAIEARVEAGDVPHVAASHEPLREALVNVVFNAIDAMPSGGRLVVRTWAADGRVQCAVADTGFGMPEEVRRRALEPFFTTKGPKSRGLGLSVCHGVVRRYGGELRVESRPGQGTTVTLSLPEATAESAPAREPGRPVALPDRLRVLVIDDDAAVREILAESLAAHGHLVTQASDGAEGLAMFRAARHDFVFTDLGMPGMTGAQVAEAIKAQSRATPVVLVTGWDEEETRATRAGGAWDAVINKPFDPNTLAEVIARVARPA
ncbi:MAG: hypothetical protein A2050_03620 [Candidatus Rokubacteria bacterium GWA2_73_35]|nr:MAG: hypothetical protein A2050_03620 [Candidatus Rokubacteria bacterium GWA2_73_35]